MLKHARKTLHTVKWSARQYSTYSKGNNSVVNFISVNNSTSYFIKLDDSTVSSFKASKAFDVVYVGTFIGTGASSMYGVWSIINSSLIPINEKLEKLDAKVGILDLNVNYIKGYLRIQEIAPKTNDSFAAAIQIIRAGMTKGKNSEILKRKNLCLPEHINKLVQIKELKLKLRKIKGHSRIPENEKANKLACKSALGDRILVPKWL
ncbi:hypothetical protein C2G38_2219338 [Gigaspora rosea]|uniref:Uncharacterized protein n=1 Tax=Gigaspora rosea TaxID=44941 RepID=A0A397TZL5_9GLOM|nr:hypothetical protein C2G38_2233770 [Gigaspora rosea]RIB05560.1 hypothetical protein C2G38_2219338 [Gigaspora rosea]